MRSRTESMAFMTVEWCMLKARPMSVKGREAISLAKYMAT